MAFLIGIDDTDNKTSRGTGFRSRQLASELELAGFGKVLGIIRHQLFVHENIPMTSQNSSNSIMVDCCDPEGLKSFCRNFMIREGLPGSNGGLCIIEEESVPDQVLEWGRRSKREVLTMDEGLRIAYDNNIFLEGIMGNKNGIIGALAAAGLRRTGNDGRFIWQPGKQLRDLSGTLTVAGLKKGTCIDDVMTKEGLVLGDDVMIDLTDWVRAVLINNKTYILAERNPKRSGSEWKVADKSYIRKIGS
jgi:tRNA(Ile2) C34 agmatinyltransferase TiaS